MKTIVIYHKDCSDGTTAAAVVLRKFPDALLFPLNHGFEASELDPILNIAGTGNTIFTVDCVLGVKNFLERGFAVISIDHHSSAKNEYKELAKENPNFTFIFDNEKSGASLVWDHFFPDEEKPEIIKLVEDRDLWRWQYGEKTKNIGYSLHMFANKPEEVLKFFEGSLENLEREGLVINHFMTKIIEHSVEKTAPIMIRIGDYIVPFYNITVNKSESGNLITTKINKAVGLFTIDGNKVTISFRSLDGQSPSALELAKALDAGGHKNASGAKMNLADFIKSIVF